MAQSSSTPARVLQRYQSQITRDLLATLEPIRLPDDQHKSQCRQRSYSGMGLQAPCLRTFLHFPLNRLRQLRDRRIQAVQQLQQILSPPARPRS